MTAPTHDAIAIRAYHIWEGEGRPHGRHDQHWFTAEAAESRADADAQARTGDLLAAPATVAAKPTPAKRAAPARKAAPATKPAAAKAPASARIVTPKAPAEAVVAAAALKAPRAARATSKGSRSAH